MTAATDAPQVRIQEDAGLWQIAVTDGHRTWARHAWTRERAEQIAQNLVALALWFRRPAE